MQTKVYVLGQPGYIEFRAGKKPPQTWVKKIWTRVPYLDHYGDVMFYQDRLVKLFTFKGGRFLGIIKRTRRKTLREVCPVLPGKGKVLELETSYARRWLDLKWRKSKGF